MLFVLLTAGCGAAAEDPGSRSLVDFRQGGSIRGLQDHLVVQPDGRAWLSTALDEKGTEFRIPRPVLRKLHRALRAARFDELRGSYRNDRPVPDDFQYEITYAGRSARADGTAVPDRLGPALGVLTQIIERQRRRTG